MAELTFKSPGVSTREIDLSGPTPIQPQGIPAGIIGPAVRGPAFVPVTVATFQDFINKFGNTDGKKFGPIAMKEWLENTTSGTYLRILGVGDGQKRNADGSVTNAGFVVGQDLPQPSNGLLGDNTFAAAANPGAEAAATAKLSVNDANAAHAQVHRQTIVLTGTNNNAVTFMTVLPLDDGTGSVSNGAVIQQNNITDAVAQAPVAATNEAEGVGSRAINPFPGTGGFNPKVVVQTADVAALDADDKFEIEFGANSTSPAAGNSLTVKIVEAAFGLEPEQDTVQIVRSFAGGYANDADVNALIVAIINGADVTAGNVARPSGGNFDDDAVIYATAASAVGKVGQTYGLTAALAVGTNDAADRAVSITSSNRTTADHTIKIKNGDAGNELLSHSGPEAGNVNLGALAADGEDALEGAELTQGDVLAAIKAAINIAFANDPSGVSAGNIAGNDLTISQKSIGIAGNTEITSRAGAGNASNIDNLNVVGGDANAPADDIFQLGLGPALDGPSIPGRTYALGCFMADVGDSTLIADTGRTDAGGSIPVVRGILMCPGGVVPSLVSSLNNAGNDSANAERAAVFKELNGVQYAQFGENMSGHPVGDLTISTQEFTLLLNGHKKNDFIDDLDLRLSFDPESPAYFVNKLNTDPNKIEEMGHYLYLHYDINKRFAVPATNTRAGNAGAAAGVTAAFCMPTQQGRNTSTATNAATDKIGVPNLESFADRYSSAKSPFIISQQFGGRNRDLFRLHALDDGSVGSGAFKITIENVVASRSAANPYGRFDVLVRKFDDTDKMPMTLEAYRAVNLDPTSDRFIAKVIGDTNTFYDFDKNSGGQKLVTEGSYPNNSSYVRVELSSDMRNDNIDATALPFGFRGIDHIVLDGTTDNNADAGGEGGCTSILDHGSAPHGASQALRAAFNNVIIPPVPMRETLSLGTGAKKIVDSDLTWGAQFENKPNPANPNSGKKIDSSILSHVRYLPNFDKSGQASSVGNNSGTADVGGSILDSDRYNNNKFSLEKIAVIVSGDLPDKELWAYSKYVRTGVLPSQLVDDEGVAKLAANDDIRFLKPSDLENSSVTKYIKFTLPLIGGFDGTNMFVRSKHEFSNEAINNEALDPNESSVSSATIATYRKALDVMEERSDVDIQLLAVPGVRNALVTDYAMESVERRFDALYLMDIEERDASDNVINTSAPVSVSNTVNAFIARDLDNSFAAAYAPDVIIPDPSTGTNVKCPPSVAVLGAIGLNDRLKFPWFAPAGYNRGVLNSTVEINTKLNRSNLDDLYDARINPLTTLPGESGTNFSKPVIFGQKTLQAAASPLDRVNVRRLLINIRRRVRAAALNILFEPNRASTLAAFSQAVNPILQDVQANQGVDRFKVVIDTTTTTQADVENNTIRGKIFLQPTRSVEFVSLDFVVSNAGGAA